MLSLIGESCALSQKENSEFFDQLFRDTLCFAGEINRQWIDILLDLVFF